MDFVTAWKASSIVLTGGFGVLGLLKDFKDKETHKVTTWGYVSLAGILLSTILGVAAQLKEASDDASKAFRLAQKTDITLNEIERGLYRLEDPRVVLTFEVPCGDDRYKTFCKELRKNDPNQDEVFAQNWIGWPSKRQLLAEVNFFVNSKDADRFETDPSSAWGDGDLSMIVQGALKSEGETLSAIPDDKGHVEVKLVDSKPEIIKNNGKFASVRDFENATGVFSYTALEPYDLRLIGFGLETKSGQRIGAYNGFGKELERRTTAVDTLWVYHFPPA
ncbi:MAG: hypothetical protein P4M04_16335 [Acidobacteriota bacterium]|nr:hypothetical protein [Acidobacteriota bacterium]